VGNWHKHWAPKNFLADGQSPGFGRPRDVGNPIRWRRWDDEEKWGVAAAYQQHKLAMQLNLVLGGKAKAADGFVLPQDATRSKRRAALARHLRMPLRTLEDRMTGRSACTSRELMGWISVAGIHAIPVVVEDLLPPSDEVEAGP
jgi:hypothetical protein